MAKKRIVNAIVFVVMLLCLIVPTCDILQSGIVVQAQEMPQITIQSRTGEDAIHRGQTFTLDIVLSNNTQGFTGIFLTLMPYDTSAFKLVNIEQGTALSKMKFTTSNTDTNYGYSYIDTRTGGFNIMWDAETNSASAGSNGVIAVLTFDSYITADLKDYDITFKYDEDNTKVNYQEPINISLRNSVVTLMTGEYTVIYQDYDGRVLYEKDCLPSDVPEYPEDMELPTREQTKEYYYEFSGFKGVVVTDKDKIVYRATYNEYAQEYTIYYYMDGEIGYADTCLYGELIDVMTKPTQENYTFMGWYLDEDCTKQITNPYMPARDLNLYGYFKYNIRDDDIPKIALYHRETVGTTAYVDAYILKNSGVNGLVLTAKYDRDALTLVGYEQGEKLQDMQFSHTNATTKADYAQENFKFYWESENNNYEIGEFLTLIFEVRSDLEDGNYEVTFTYEEGKEATYVYSSTEIWYTKLDILSGSVPIGLRYHWNEEMEVQEEKVDIDVVSEEGKSYNTMLLVEDVTKQTKIDLSSDYITEVIGEDNKISSVYTTSMQKAQYEIEPNTELDIKIKLTVEQLDSPYVSLYYINDNKELIYYNSKKEDGYLCFNASFLADWVIVCEVVRLDGKIGPNTTILILLPTLLAVVTMGTFLIYLGKKRRF